MAKTKRGRRIDLALVSIALLFLAAPAAIGDSPPATSSTPPATSPFVSATLPPVGDHFVWVADAVFMHSQLFDGDTGKMLATIDGGTTLSPKPPLYAPGRNEFYSVEIVYDRGRRGRRTDFVTIYDAVTLEVTGEIILPTRAGESAASLGYIALLDDHRFLAVFNHFPVTSVSIIDLEARSFVGEVVTAGCAGIYPAGPRSFGMLCGDGTVAQFTLDEEGRLESSAASERFFDAVNDPAVLAAGRLGDSWIFPSFLGEAHRVDFSTTPPTASSWSLVTDAERAAGWRPGGRQLAALNAATGRFYVLFHQGVAGSHKSPGPELWVYDVAQQQRIDRFAIPNLTASFLLGQFGGEQTGTTAWLLKAIVPDEGADTVAVTRDANPLVFVRSSERGSVAVIDGRTGEHLRDLTEVGLGGSRLEVP
jgi:methylamine dehydrogenase heavy chain